MKGKLNLTLAVCAVFLCGISPASAQQIQLGKKFTITSTPTSSPEATVTNSGQTSAATQNTSGITIKIRNHATQTNEPLPQELYVIPKGETVPQRYHPKLLALNAAGNEVDVVWTLKKLTTGNSGEIKETSYAGPISNSTISFWSNETLRKFTPEPGTYRLIANPVNDNNMVIAAVIVKVVGVYIHSIDFVGANNYVMKKDTRQSLLWSNTSISTELSLLNTLMDSPEIQDNDYNGIFEINEPTCYKRGSTPQMNLTLKVIPTLPDKLDVTVSLFGDGIKAGNAEKRIDVTLYSCTVDLSKGDKQVFNNCEWTFPLDNYVTNKKVPFGLSYTYTAQDDNGNPIQNASTTVIVLDKAKNNYFHFFQTYDAPIPEARSVARLNWATEKVRTETGAQVKDADNLSLNFVIRKIFNLVKDFGLGNTELPDNGIWTFDGKLCTYKTNANIMKAILAELGIHSAYTPVYPSLQAGVGQCLLPENSRQVSINQMMQQVDLYLVYQLPGLPNSQKKYYNRIDCLKVDNLFYVFSVNKFTEINDYMVISNGHFQQQEWGYIKDNEFVPYGNSISIP